MKINGNEIRPGYIILHKDRLWSAVKTQHTQPGKGGAYLQVELKDIRSGTKLNERFRSSESVERVRLDEMECQYLYTDGDNIVLMDPVSFFHCASPSKIAVRTRRALSRPGEYELLSTLEQTGPPALSINSTYVRHPRHRPAQRHPDL